jgi:hypothetical protein
MTTYKFICETESESWSHVPSGRVEHTVVDPGLDELLRHIEYFLRGCSFNPAGELDFVVDDFIEGEYDE